MFEMRRTSATNICNEHLQRISATDICNGHLQRTSATDICNEHLQRTSAANITLRINSYIVLSDWTTKNSVINFLKPNHDSIRGLSEMRLGQPKADFSLRLISAFSTLQLCYLECWQLPTSCPSIFFRLSSYLYMFVYSVIHTTLIHTTIVGRSVGRPIGCLL